MTTRMFNPGPVPFVSPTGGVFAPGEHIVTESLESLYPAVQRGRLLAVEEADPVVLEPAGAGIQALTPVDDGPGDDEIVEVESTEEIVIDDPEITDAATPKPGPPAKKTTAPKTAPAEKD